MNQIDDEHTRPQCGNDLGERVVRNVLRASAARPDHGSQGKSDVRQDKHAEYDPDFEHQLAVRYVGRWWQELLLFGRLPALDRRSFQQRIGLWWLAHGVL